MTGFLPSSASTTVNNTLKPWLNCVISENCNKICLRRGEEEKCAHLIYCRESKQENLKDAGLLECSKTSPNTQ